jgi:predicted kinase
MRDDRPEALNRPETLDRRAAADGPPQDTPPPADLSRRLDSLPDGHPSSRYEADGTLRHPPVRLTDLDTGPEEDTPTPDDPEMIDPGIDAERCADIERLDVEQPADQKPLITDAEWAEHVTEVRETLDKAQLAGLSTDRQHTIDSSRSVWSEVRDLIHDTIIEDLYNRSQDVPCERKAIMAGGLGGSGKTTVLSGHAGIDLSQYITINPDKVKEEMANRGLVPEVDGLTPMEASDLVHEESSHIAKRLARRAEAEGKNIIWDITMSSRDSTKSRIDNLHAEEYTVDGIFVDIPVETSVHRADARHREGHSDYLAGFGLGGRYVPPEVIEAQADPEWGSKNRRTFEEIHHLFDHWSRYDNSVDGRPPVTAQTDLSIDLNREEKS